MHDYRNASIVPLMRMNLYLVESVVHDAGTAVLLSFFFFVFFLFSVYRHLHVVTQNVRATQLY